MKLSGIVVTILLFISSFIFAEPLSPYFQGKKNNVQRQGITYTVILPPEKNSTDKRYYTVTEQGKNKLFESEQYMNNRYLLSDNKVYQLPDLTDVSDDTLVSILLLSSNARTMFDEQVENFTLPNYAGFVIEDKKVVNGYKCQVAYKVINEQKRFDEDDKKFIVQRILKVYITEKYGYPTRMERVIRSKYPKETNWTEAIQEQDTVNIVNFNTDISGKNLTLPKNAFVVNVSNPASLIMRKDIKQQQTLFETSEEEEE